LISVNPQSGCDVSLSACGVKNAQYSWTGPGGGNAGNTQSITANASGAAGDYTVSLTVPGASTGNNTCSQNNPVVNSTANVAFNCGCSNALQIVNPTIEYRHISTTGVITNNYVQNLATCTTNNLCYVYANGDDLFNLDASSSEATGNIWEARIVSVSPFTNGGGIMGAFNGNSIPYPYSGSYLTIGTGQNISLEVFFPAVEVFILEVKLTNTTLGVTKTLYIKSVPYNGATPSSFWCIQTSPAAAYPHMMMLGLDGSGNYMDLPGFSYQWTFPTGMTMLTSTNHIHVEWDDTGFDYVTTPNPIATLHVSNIYGCGDYDINLDITPGNCNIPHRQAGNSAKSELKNIKTLKTGVYPNPVHTTLHIQAAQIINELTIQTVDGRVVKKMTMVKPGQQINVGSLQAGTYLMTLRYKDNSKETKVIIKQ